MAGLNSLIEDFENELTCSICHDIFKEPKTLPCLHSYCTKCIVQWYQTSGNRVTNRFHCPICKAETDMPDGDVSKLRSSFYFNSLLQLVHAMKTKANQPGLSDCISCEKPQELVAFCPQCNGLICAECLSIHAYVKQLRDKHQPTTLDKFKKENVKSFIKNKMLCNEKFHEENKLEYFCLEETCRRCICQKCFALYHQNHRMQSLEEAGESAIQAVQEDMDRVSLLKEKYEEELEQSKRNMERIRGEIEVAKKEVDDAVEMVCKIVKERGRVMKSELNQTLHEQQTANDEEQTDIKTGIKRLTELPQRWEALKNTGLLNEIIQSKEELQEACKSLLDIPSLLCSKPIQRNVTVQCQINQQVMQSLQNVAKIVKSVTYPPRCTIESLKEARTGFINGFNIITRNSKMEKCHTEIESIDVKIKDGEGNEIAKKEVCKQQPGQYRVSYKVKKDGMYHIQVNIAGEPINNSPQNVNILDMKELFKPLKTFGGQGSGKGQLNRPRSIAVSDNGEIAIADYLNNRIQIFGPHGTCLREFGTKGLFTPFGVLFNEDKMIVSDRPDSNGRIQEFNLNGSYVRTIYRPKQWFFPCGMCVNDDKNIAVCCRGNKELGIKPSIKVLSKEGLVKEFYMPGNDEQPWYVTCGNGKYFVSCSNKHYVSVFDENGVFLYKFGEQGKSEGQFDGVRGLAVYGPDMILVCDADNHRVHVLTQEGRSITSFGGLGDGQMNEPTDVRGTTDGRVIVLDSAGNRANNWC